MKNKFILILAMICFATTFVNAQKIGYLNTNDLLVMMPEVKQADSVLQQYASEMQKIYSGYVIEYQQKLAASSRCGASKKGQSVCVERRIA